MMKGRGDKTRLPCKHVSSPRFQTPPAPPATQILYVLVNPENSAAYVLLRYRFRAYTPQSFSGAQLFIMRVFFCSSRLATTYYLPVISQALAYCPSSLGCVTLGITVAALSRSFAAT